MDPLKNEVLPKTLSSQINSGKTWTFWENKTKEQQRMIDRRKVRMSSPGRPLSSKESRARDLKKLERLKKEVKELEEKIK